MGLRRDNGSTEKGEEKARYQTNCLMAIFDPPNGDNIALELFQVCATGTRKSMDKVTDERTWT